MSTETLAWVLRTIMVTVSAVCAFVLAQEDVGLEPVWRVVLGAIIVAISAINPQSIVERFAGASA